MQPRSDHSKAFFVLGCGLVNGAVGFICGFCGPGLLNPSANQGPLLGIFITGPACFFLGLMVGAVVGYLKPKPAIRNTILCLTTTFLACCTLYLSMPTDRWQGFIIDAEVRGCSSPSTFVQKAEDYWSTSYFAPSGNKPRAGWRSDVPQMLESQPGQVVKMLVHRRREIYKQMKPWNKGRLRASKWLAIEKEENYFAQDASASSPACQIGYRAMYSPQWQVPLEAPPPRNLPTFLLLYSLKNVPNEYQVFIGKDAKAAN